MGAHGMRTSTEFFMVTIWMRGKFLQGPQSAHCPGQNIVTRMLTRDLFAVANPVTTFASGIFGVLYLLSRQ